MVDNKIIESIWKTIVYHGNSQFVYKRLSLYGKPSVNIGLNLNLQRCLILELPKQTTLTLPNVIKQNLSLEYHENSKSVCIILLDNIFYDLFDDFILSIFNRIAEISDSDEYLREFIHSFYKWSSFFEDKKTHRLTKNDVKGLFGELFFLKNLLLNNPLNVDNFLKSWRGPYDESHDFVNDFIDYEIKTIDPSKNNIRISSEYQLESEKGKELELIVILIAEDSINGVSLNTLVNEIKIFALNNLGDYSILLDALSQRGLTFSNIGYYDVYKFQAKKETSYMCQDEKFPRLNRSDLPREINKVQYNIRLNLIESFIINEIKY
jgi:hypothetical protein